MNPINILLAIAIGPASPVQISAPKPEAPATNPANSSSEWLRTGEALQERGQHVEASAAYLEALAALPEAKRRANEGARAAMLVADARWASFGSSGDVAHLDAGIGALERWLSLAGPQSRASLLEDVQREVAQARAVRIPLVAATSALAERDLEGAAARCNQVLDALVHQGHREWSIGAGLSLRIVDEVIAIYDFDLASGTSAAHLRALEQARDMLARWRERQSPSDASERGAAIDERIVALDLRIDAARRPPLDPVIEAQPLEPNDAIAESRVPAWRLEAPPELANDHPPRAPQRPLAITLLTVGGVATAAGVAFLAEGTAFTRISEERVTQATAESSALGDPSEQARYHAEIDAYQSKARRRNIGMLIGGSAAAAVGVGTAVVGILMLARGNRPHGNRLRDRAQLSPIVSPTRQQLIMSWRF